MTLERFRQHFETKGEVTDAKLVQTRSGNTRHFGFIGYKSNQQAKEAVQHFNNTYFDTSKIQVELAKPVSFKKKLMNLIL